MEPITHALTSLALARAGLNKAAHLATPMLLVSGLAADLDWLSLAGGPRAFLHGHRTATHSLLGTVAIALVTAGVFWALGRKHSARPLRFWRAGMVCGAGAAAHLLLDLTNSYGVTLLWPFREKWFAGDLMEALDPAVLVALLLGLLLPGLFRLVSEEIGARPKRTGPKRGAIAALVVVTLYCGARWTLHDRALELLRSRLYHGQAPLLAGAFPGGASPLAWTGIVETDSRLERVDLSLAAAGSFDPDAGRAYFKPEPSPALEAALKSAYAQEYLKFARFPRATVEKTADGYRVELRDLRMASPLAGWGDLIAVIELNPLAQVTGEALRFASAPEK